MQNNFKNDPAENKLIIMYFIKRSGYPVSAAHIQDFMLSIDGVDYFTLTKYIAESLECGHVEQFRENNQTFYNLTEDGSTVLSYFDNRIPKEIKNSANEYITKKITQIKNEVEVTAKYTETDADNYLVECGVYENEKPLMEISLMAVSKEYANHICRNWKNNSDDIFQAMLKNLLGDVPDNFNNKEAAAVNKKSTKRKSRVRRL